MVRSELAPDGGACPIPTHGPQTGSSIRTPPSTSWRYTPDSAIAARIWREPGVAVAATSALTIGPPRSASIAAGRARWAYPDFTDEPSRFWATGVLGTSAPGMSWWGLCGWA